MDRGRGTRGASTGNRSEELARQAVEAGIRRYCVDRRARIPEFVDRHFSLRGATRLHCAALGWDVVRAPVNLTMAAPAAMLHLIAAGARRVGAVSLARRLSRTRLFLPTAVARRVEYLVYTELLELPYALGEAILSEPAALEALRARLRSIGLDAEDPLLSRQLRQMVTEYAGTRAASAEIATGLVSLTTGALTLGKLTPGAASFGPMLASIIAQQAAIASFPLGAALGSVWYAVFPAAPSTGLLLGLSSGLMIGGSVLAAFAGIVTDPVQRLLGLHQRRLRKMIDAMERQMLDATAPGFAVRDRYVARLLDVFDLLTATHRLAH